MPITSADHPLTAAINEVLRQGETLLHSITDAAYTRRLEVAFNASIGGHFRHCLEHFEALLHGDSLNPSFRNIDYDARKRDPVIENDRSRALSRTQALARIFEKFDHPGWDDTVQVRCKASYADEPFPVRSTLGREAMYAIMHAIHHYALISIMARMMSLSLPDDFGVAPSTVRHLENQSSQRLNGSSVPCAKTVDRPS